MRAFSHNVARHHFPISRRFYLIYLARFLRLAPIYAVKKPHFPSRSRSHSRQSKKGVCLQMRQFSLISWRKAQTLLFVNCSRIDELQWHAHVMWEKLSAFIISMRLPSQSWAFYMIQKRQDMALTPLWWEADQYLGNKDWQVMIKYCWIRQKFYEQVFHFC